MDSDALDLAQAALTARLRDRAPAVRTKAASGLARLQGDGGVGEDGEEDELVQVFRGMLAGERIKEVRARRRK